jgi:NADH:ubiquinone oxidoreductase subunit F (NADH-binding)
VRSRMASSTATLSQAPAFPRLLSALESSDSVVDLEAHLAHWGTLPLRRARSTLLDELDSSGLRGHGGAWFPVGKKWRGVRDGSRRPVVVGNGSESEPASRKDGFLLTHSPHLVLDGASLAAAALDAHRVVVFIPLRHVDSVGRCVQARSRAGIDPVKIEVVAAADAYLAGQETAVVHALNDGPAVPTFVGLQSIRERGVRNRPTLVQNVESLAHVAMISRYGGQWFRSMGTADSPGTMLVTITGRWTEPVVVEAPLGLPFRDLLHLATEDIHRYWGALLGGYGGGWVPSSVLLEGSLSEDWARPQSTSLGAGVVALLPRSCCPLAESARVVRYMEQQGAGQCGPCRYGLADLAGHLELLAFRPDSFRGRFPPILELCNLIDGRGACRHPDGVTRFVRTAIAVFQEDVDRHFRRGLCDAVNRAAYLPCPSATAWNG